MVSSKRRLVRFALRAAQMALATLDSHNFAATGDMEAAFGPFMGFDFVKKQWGLNESLEEWMHGQIPRVHPGEEGARAIGE